MSSMRKVRLFAEWYKQGLNEIKLCSNLRTQSIRPSLLNVPKNFFPQATTTCGLHFYLLNGPEE